MPRITLPNGEVRAFDSALTVHELAAAISPHLARAAVLGRVDGRLVDLSDVVHSDASVQILTAEAPEALEVLRHSTAHLLAYAVKCLFPDVQVAIGPVIADGFYYDFLSPHAFSPSDLAAIEEKMHNIAAQNHPVVLEVWARERAMEYFAAENEPLKLEIVAGIPPEQPLTVYRMGEFTDLCRGPHVLSTGRLSVFKLTKISGAYWRGDAKNQPLQRIYGTAWFSEKEQDAYFHRLEEAERRDHRKIARELDFFHFQEEAPGLIFWHPKGWIIWQEIERYLREAYRDFGYEEVKSPQILDRALWERTGHWQNYREHMFTTESEHRSYALKPMNCPGHVLIFSSSLRSYRDLPVRYGEFGQCHRNEPSGALHGILRVRGFTQDDGHVFCTPEQILGECTAFTAQLQAVYRDFGFSEILYKVATRPLHRVGTDELWDKAEAAVFESLRQSNCHFTISEGEGAFYGPKIEYTLKDAIGRLWQCGTIQIDFNTAERLGAEYVADDNSRRTPVMLHRAIVGSLERFIGILIEHHAGALPVWLAPVQVAVMNITDAQLDYAAQVVKSLQTEGVRAQLDGRNEKVNYKVRQAGVSRIPYVVVVGDREKASGAVSVRVRGGSAQKVLSLLEFTAWVKSDISLRHAQPSCCSSGV